MYLGCAQVSEHVLTSPRLASPEVGSDFSSDHTLDRLVGKVLGAAARANEVGGPAWIFVFLSHGFFSLILVRTVETS